MRKDPNMMLRGATWCLRVAVPKRLQEIRAEQGIRSNKEVWRTLGTGDYRTAKARLTQIKAEVFRSFEAEERQWVQRPVPTVSDSEAIARDFARLVRTSLANERLLELPTALTVEQAKADQARVAIALDAATDPDVAQRLSLEYFDFDPTIFAAEDQQEARQALRDRLWCNLDARDYRLVDPFITQAARARSYRIDGDSVAYRQLAHLLLKAWIGELDRASDAFVSLEEALHDQDEALIAWQSPIPTADFKAARSEQPEVGEPIVVPARDIRHLFETYLREKFPKMAPNALLDRRRTIEQFIEIAGLRDVAEYRKLHVTNYKTALIELPINAGRDYAGKTMREVTDLAPKGAKRLAPKTVKSRLSILGSFGRWLSENVDGVDDSNFRTTAPVAKRPETVVREFSDADVRRIFSSPTFTGCESERNQRALGSYRVRDYRYWLPMMAAYTGCRLNELAQLRVADVHQLNGIWALRISDAGEGQSLKTKASGRLVPVHSALLAAGLIEYVESVRRRGQQDLFCDIPVGRNGRRSEAAGKWFRKFLVRLGMKEGRGGMHRFRHGFVQKLRDQGHSDVEIAMIVGHEARVAPMTAGYGSSRNAMIHQQQKIIETLSYGELASMGTGDE